VREVFDLFDEDTDGIISRGEVALVIQSMLGESVQHDIATFYLLVRLYLIQ
jgi:Ca2+-binding EF-hand superfamily protein